MVKNAAPATPSKNALIVGVSGQVGYQLLLHLYKSGQYKNIFGTYNYRAIILRISQDLNIDAESMSSSNNIFRNRMEQRQSDYDEIYLPAYITNVEKFNIDDRDKINGYLKQIIEWSPKSKFIFYSTDYVFDEGEKVETDFPKPLNEYGLAKILMEHYILANCKDPLIIRTSGVFGFDYQGKNFLYRLLALKYGTNNSPIMAPIDQYGSPTYSPDLVNKTIKLVERNASGIFHITGAENINRYEFAMRICDKFKIDKNKIYGVTTKSLEQKQLRPLQLKLITKKAEKYLGEKMIDINKALNAFKTIKE